MSAPAAIKLYAPGVFTVIGIIVILVLTIFQCGHGCGEGGEGG
jgi:hypothetical protein